MSSLSDETAPTGWARPTRRVVRRILSACPAVALAWVISFSSRALAADPAALSHGPKAPGAGSLESRLKASAPGQFLLGEVLLDHKRREVTIPCELNMDSGLLEYLLVSEQGKRHESLLWTRCEPIQVHSALLLLRARGAPSNRVARLPSQEAPGLRPTAEQLPGDRVVVRVEWTNGLDRVVRPAGELVFNTHARRSPLQGPWVFNGSFLEQAGFAAQLSGSLISLVTDPGALINSLAAGHERDDVWIPHAGFLPPLKTTVRVVIQLTNPTSPAETPPKP